ncbi:phosphonate metabolism protein PhnP [Salinibius halmophilus]|uniref:phosphonate metabolism protein PhnP n=1 Tax=Salinibius halmophilus TaxID=1853216 RepID=UPI000E66A0A5|nr:phosphonate metabolism protein PhnP [Salinibius halmophilus]
MKLTQLGTANTAGVPVYGCHCTVCTKARVYSHLQRQKTSAMVEHNGKRLLVDVNHPELASRYAPTDIERVLLTHYHMDHVMQMFDMRWGVGRIPVYGPNDEVGCDDLFKHPGLFHFAPALKAFQTFDWFGVNITPLPLNHSRPTFGYAFEYQGQIIAYLTDTYGLPEDTRQWLLARNLYLVLIDSSHPPGESQGGHNDILMSKALFEQLQPIYMGLIHLSHEALEWTEQHPEFFSDRFFIVNDQQEFEL